jgi:hypothetical protein
MNINNVKGTKMIFGEIGEITGIRTDLIKSYFYDGDFH